MNATCELNISSVTNGITEDITNKLLNSGVFTQSEGVFTPDESADYQSVIDQINQDYQEDLVLPSGFGANEFSIGEPSQKLLSKYLTPSPLVNYSLKSVEILSSDKAKEIFQKGKDKGWELSKVLQELQIPKDQAQIILQSGLTEPEAIVQDLLAKSSYAVEINISKDRIGSDIYGKAYEPKLINDEEAASATGGKIGQYWVEFINNDGDPDVKIFDTFAQARSAVDTQQGLTNSKVYERMTVPGGTNYTENEIATPAITPSIKGHAQFATENGIGWFRSDDKILTGTERIIDSKDRYADGWIVPDDIDFGKPKKLIDGDSSKTRRILEVQSDLFQKGRDKDLLVNTDNKILDGKDQKDENDYYVEDEYDDGQFRIKTPEGIYFRSEDNYLFRANNGTVKDNKNISKEVYFSKIKETKGIGLKENQFLQLLNKDNNWATFFVKSIIQDSAKKGYEKVLFPSGDTAAKVEGHETVQGFIDTKEARIKELEKSLDYRINNIEQVPSRNFIFLDNKGETVRLRKPNNNWTITYLTGKENIIEQNTTEDIVIKGFNKYLSDEGNNVKNEIKQLEKEIEDAKAGRLKISSIANFYEKDIKNILKKQGYSPTSVTDEYGNTWNEVEIIPATQVSEEQKNTPKLSTAQNAQFERLQESGIISKDTNTFAGRTYYKILGDNAERLQDIIKNKGLNFLHIRGTNLVEVGTADNIMLSINTDEKSPTKSTKAGEITKNRVLKFLANIGFTNIQTVNQLVHNGERLIDDAYIDFVNGVMQIVEGKEDYTLPEESMHILVELIKNSNKELYARMSKEIINYKLYNDVVTEYSKNKLYQDEDGNPNYAKIKDEAIAKLLTEFLIGELENKNVKTETIYNWWHAIRQWIRETFGQFKNPFKEALDEINQDDNTFGDFVDLTSDDIFLSAKSVEEIDKENPDNKTLFENIVNRPNEENISKIGASYYKDGKRINYSADELEDFTIQQLIEAGNELDLLLKGDNKENLIKQIRDQQAERVSDITARYNDEIFRNRNFDPALEDFYDQSRQDGDYIHKMIEEIINSWIDPVTGLMKRNQTKLTFPIPDNPLSKEMSETLNTYIKGLMASYDTGTRFIVEQIIFDPTATFNGKVKGRYGTIDFLAIKPDGEVDILDWKSILDLDVEGAKDYKKQGIFLQIEEYKRILKEQYGVTKFGKIRAIPINKTYSKPALGQKRVLRKIEIGNSDPSKIKEEDRRLRPIISPVESTGSELKDEVIEKLSALYKKYIDEGYFKDDRTILNNINEAIYEIRVSNQVTKLSTYITDVNNKLSAILAEKDNFVKNSNKQDISEALSILKLYDDIIKNVVEPASELEDDTSIDENGRKLLYKKTNTAKKLATKIPDLRAALLEASAVREANIFDLLLPEKVVNVAQKLFRSMGSQNIATIRYMFELTKKAYNKIDFATDMALKTLKGLKFDFDNWAKDKGISDKDAIGMLVNYKTGRLHSKIDKAFYEARSDVQTGRKGELIKKFVSENYNVDDYLNWYASELQALKDKHANTTYDSNAKNDAKIKKNAIKQFQVNYDINTYPVTAFGSHNKRIWSRNIKEELWESAEYKVITEPGNEALLATYNFMVQKNKELAATGAIEDYNAYTFFPNMRKGLGDILNLEDSNFLSKIKDLTVQQYTDWRRKISADDYELNFEGQRDPFTGEKIAKRFVPFVSGMNAENKSFDLFSVYGLMSKEIAKEKYLSENDNIIIALGQLEKSKDNLLKDKFGNLILDGNGRPKKGKQLNADSDITVNAALAQEHVRAIVNGESIQFDGDHIIQMKLREKWNKSFAGKLYKFDTESKEYNPTSISATKFLMWLNTANQKRILGVNLASAMSNLFGGMYASNKLYQKYASKKDLHEASIRMTSGNFYGTEDMKKRAALVDFVLPLLNNRESFKSSQLSVSEAATVLSQEWLMAPMRLTSEKVQLNIFLAVIENTGVIDGKMVNFREEAAKLTGWDERYSVGPEERKTLEKDFENKIKELKEKYSLSKIATYKTIQENGKDKIVLEIPGIARDSKDIEELREIVQTMAKDALGEADEFDVASYKYGIWWRLFMTFKNWIPRQADVRWGEFRFDQGHHAYEYGRFRMFSKALSVSYVQAAAKIIPLGFITKGLTDLAFSKEGLIIRAKEVYQEKIKSEKLIGKYNKDTFISESEFIDKFIQGTESTYAEIRTLLLMTGALFLGLAAPDDDDDSEDKAYKVLLRKQVNKLIDEVGFFYSPKSGIDIAGGGAPVFSIIRDGWFLMTNVSDQFFGYTLEQLGADEKGVKMQESAKPVKRLFKVVPALKEILTYLPAVDEQTAKDWGVKISDQRNF